MLKKLILLCFIMVILGIDPVSAEMLRSKIKRGANYYRQQKYDQALKDFIDAQIEAPEDAQLSYNIGNAYYKMKNYDEAIKNFLNSAVSAKDVKLEEKSYYNLGNSLYRQGKLEAAVAYYQKVLELDPNDLDAKRNLEFVREEIKRRINQEKKRQQQQQGQEAQGEQQQKQQSRQAKEQQEKKEGEKHPQAAGSKEEKGQDKGQQAQQQTVQAGQRMSDEEAQRWLDSLSEDKREFLKQQMKSLPGRGYTSGKDW